MNFEQMLGDVAARIKSEWDGKNTKEIFAHRKEGSGYNHNYYHSPEGLVFGECCGLSGTEAFFLVDDDGEFIPIGYGLAKDGVFRAYFDWCT